MTSSVTLSKVTNETNQLAFALTPGTARKRFLANVGANLGFLLVSTIVAMWYTPFLIRHLGIGTYGVVPLATMVIPYMLIATNSLNVAIKRFLAIDLNRGDKAAANRTFNAALAGSIYIVGGLFPIGLAIAWFFPTLFNVPPGLENEARLLFGLMVVSFFLTTLSRNFGVSMVILHRFDLRNQVDGLALATRVGLVALLFTVLPVRLWYVGTAFVASAIVTLAGEWFWWRRLTPQLQVSPSAFDRARLGELLGMGGWAVVNSIGALLLMNVSLLVVNAFFGPEMTGRYATVLLFFVLIRTLGSTVSSILSPAIVARYAQQDFEGLRRLVFRAVKLMGIAIALPIGLLSGFARPLLNIWLGPDFQNLDVLLIVVVGHLSVNLATLPLLYVLTCYNKVRVQGIVTLILGGVSVGLAIAMASWGGWGVVGVAAAVAFSWTIKNLLFLSGYSAHVMNMRWWAFGPSLVAAAVSAVVVGLVAYGLAQVWRPENWFILGGMALAVSLGYGLVAYFLYLSREDRRFLLDFVPGAIRNYLG